MLCKQTIHVAYHVKSDYFVLERAGNEFSAALVELTTKKLCADSLMSNFRLKLFMFKTQLNYGKVKVSICKLLILLRKTQLLCVLLLSRVVRTDPLFTEHSLFKRTKHLIRCATWNMSRNLRNWVLCFNEMNLL